MKKIMFLLAFLAVISISTLANAASLYKEDFSNINSQTFNLKEKDAIRLSIFGNETEIMLREVFEEKNAVKLTIFIPGAETPVYVTLSSGQTMYTDLDKDRVKDIATKAIYISKENTILAISKLEPSEQSQQSNELTGESSLTINEKPSIKTGIYISVAIIILGLIVYFIVRRKKR